MTGTLKNILFSFFTVFIMMHSIYAQDVIITPQVIGTVSPFLAQTITSSNQIIRVTIMSTPPGSSGNVEVFAKLERTAPGSFSISLRDRSTAKKVPFSSIARVLTNDELASMFGDFMPGKLLFNGISLSDLTDGVNYKLPEGTYSLCFSTDFNFSPGLTIGCAYFTICKSSAPQFIQPVNNLNITSGITRIQPASPVVFTWMPPRAACGVISNFYNYDLEIREMYANQGVTDAINNPITFRKTLITSTIFLLDTNLYKNVLEPGKRYVIRVKANTQGMVPFVDTSIGNYGYSRIEAFEYGNGRNGRGLRALPLNLGNIYFTLTDQRLSSKLDDIYMAFQKHERSDTSIEIKNYIRLILMEKDITYSPDAIELFLALNPDLIDSKSVKLSYTPKLPNFPEVPENNREIFNLEHEKNLTPDSLQAKLFMTYTDSLTNAVKATLINDTAAVAINNLLNKLNVYGMHVYRSSRLSVKLINDYLSELIYVLYKSKISEKNKNNAVFKLVNNLDELIATPSIATYAQHGITLTKKSSLSSYKEKAPSQDESGIAGYREDSKKVTVLQYMQTPVIRPISFNIVVYHYSKEDASKPILNTADLMATYRVFYVSSGLFNHLNPEINAQNTAAPASTAQVTLPETKFMFWTQNMLNRHLTKAQEIDLMDVYLNSKKKWPYLTRPSVILKVE